MIAHAKLDTTPEELEALAERKASPGCTRSVKLVSEGQSYREISHRLGLSKNTVLAIVKRDRAA